MAGIAIVGIVVSTALGCKGGTADPNSSIGGPSRTALTGVWTGTIGRSGAVTPIAVRIDATHANDTFTGPITLTLDRVTLRGQVRGSTTSDTLFMPLNINDQATLPNCVVRSGPDMGPDLNFRPVTNSTRTLTATNTMRYINCQGFVPPDPQSDSRVESGVQITLNKQ